VSGPIVQLDLVRPGARGVIGALARSADHTLALTARHLLGMFEAPKGVIESADLIGWVPLAPGSMIGGRAARGGCADPDRLLGQSVYRFCGEDRAPGVVTALHGALRLRLCDSQETFVCTDIVEVTFDPTRASGPEANRTRREMPPLDGMDAGSLVVTADDRAVGIIVAGEGHRAYLAPLRPFLDARGLSLAASPARVQRPNAPLAPDDPVATLTLACTSLVDDLAREPSLDLGMMPEAA
jgi:hypothetical protein